MMNKSRWIGAAVLPVLLAHCDEEDPMRRVAEADDDESPVGFESADAFARHIGSLHGGAEAVGLARPAGLTDPRSVLC